MSGISYHRAQNPCNLARTNKFNHIYIQADRFLSVVENCPDYSNKVCDTLNFRSMHTRSRSNSFVYI